jgi:hypothetical protein
VCQSLHQIDSYVNHLEDQDTLFTSTILAKHVILHVFEDESFRFGLIML